MAATIDTHAMLTPVATSSTTGNLTASAGDLAVIAVFTSTGVTVPTGTVTGASLTWQSVSDTTLSSTRLQIFTANVPVAISAQTITITITNATSIRGSIIAYGGAQRIGGVTLGNNAGVTTVTRTLIIRNNGNIMVALVNASDTVWTSPASALDNDGTTFSGQSGNAAQLAGTNSSIIATSAGGNIASSAAYEIVAAGAKLNNSGLRPHPFSPGLAR